MARCWASLTGAGVLAFSIGAAQAATIVYRATLNGASEVPPVVTRGSGTADVEFDTTTRAIVSWGLEFSRLSGPATAAYIHCGAPPGANAGASIALGLPGIPGIESPYIVARTVPLTNTQIAELQAGMCYVDVDTAAHKNGEIRGQLMPEAR